MFCKNCGQAIDDNAKFCKNCGTQVEPQASVTTSSFSIPAKSIKKSWIIIALIVIVAIIIIMPSNSGGGTSSYEKTALQFTEAIYEADAKTCVNLMTDEAIDEMGCATRKIAINKTQEVLDEAVKQYKDKYGNKWKYDIEIIDSYPYNGYTYYPYEEVMCVMLKTTITGSGLFNDKEGTETATLIVVKEDNKWYVAD